MGSDRIDTFPESTPTTFSQQAALENLGRLRFTIPLVFLLESALSLSFGLLSTLPWHILAILIFHGVCIPKVFAAYTLSFTLRIYAARIIEFSFSLTSLLFAVYTVPWPTGDGLYFFFIIVTGFCLFWSPVERVILLVIPYVYYGIQALETSLPMERMVLVTVVTCCAWILGQTLFSMKKNVYTKTQRLEQTNETMQQLMQKDEMTDLYTHNTIFSRLREEILRSRRIGYPLTLMMIDIDDFKTVNDTFGHLTGDEVIRAAAHTLLDTARETDIIGRYGGDEFMIIMPDTDAQGAQIFSQRLEHSISLLALPGGVRITFSGGYCQHTRETLNEFIQKADEFLYQAKAAGKNQFIG